MSWNWLGWLLWIAAIAFLVYVIHYIRVKQLMLIAKTHQRFEKGLFFRYVVLVVIAIAWLGFMGYATWLLYYMLIAARLLPRRLIRPCNCPVVAMITITCELITVMPVTMVSFLILIKPRTGTILPVPTLVP